MAIKIMLDPGHGGTEQGATANGYIEKDLNLKLSLLLKYELQRCGFTVYMTRETDINVDLELRGKLATQNQCDCLLSVHFNAMGRANVAKGFEAIYSFQSESAKWIALCISKQAVGLGLYDRGVWSKESDNYKGHNWYGVLRSSEPCPGVILEGLFLDNENDVRFLADPGFLKKLAVAYCKGVCAAYSIAYVPEPVSAPVKHDPAAGQKEILNQVKTKMQEIISLLEKL
jgi:N-acetylmuramoyl-L-alanine amidase